MKIKVIGTIVIILGILSLYLTFFFFKVDVRPKPAEYVIRSICLVMNILIVAGMLAFIKTKIPDERVLAINYVALAILIIGCIAGVVILESFGSE